MNHGVRGKAKAYLVTICYSVVTRFLVVFFQNRVMTMMMMMMMFCRWPPFAIVTEQLLVTVENFLA